MQNAERTRWQNRLPEWIATNEQFLKLRPPVMATLRAIANRCTRPGASGDLVGAFGGAGLIVDAVGVSACGKPARSTFWLHVRRLESLGFVVALNRGGCVHGRNLGNHWAIPGRVGSLDGRRLSMIDGKRRPTNPVGGTGWLWAEIEPPDPEPNPDGSGPIRPAESVPDGPIAVIGPGGVVNKPDDRRPNAGRAAPECWARGARMLDDRRPNAGHHQQQSTPKATPQQRRHVRGRLPSVSSADLSDTGRMVELFGSAVRSGLVNAGQSDRLRFFAAAVYAKRTGTNPSKLFAAIVNNGSWLWITESDGQTAYDWIKREFYDAPGPDVPDAKSSV